MSKNPIKNDKNFVINTNFYLFGHKDCYFTRKKQKISYLTIRQSLVKISIFFKTPESGLVRKKLLAHLS